MTRLAPCHQRFTKGEIKSCNFFNNHWLLIPVTIHQIYIGPWKIFILLFLCSHQLLQIHIFFFGVLVFISQFLHERKQQTVRKLKPIRKDKVDLHLYSSSGSHSGSGSVWGSGSSLDWADARFVYHFWRTNLLENAIAVSWIWAPELGAVWFADHQRNVQNKPIGNELVLATSRVSLDQPCR